MHKGGVVRQFCTIGVLNAATQHIFLDIVVTLSDLLVPATWTIHAANANLTGADEVTLKGFFVFLKDALDDLGSK